MPVGAARRNKYLLNCRALCRWAVRMRGLPADPTDGIRLGSVEQALKPQFSLAEIEKLVGGKDSASKRWVVIMLLAGLRSDEARCLRWQDCDFQAGVLVVSLDSGAAVKRRRERLVPIQPALRALLEPLRGERPGDAVAGLGRGNLQRAFADYLTARNVPSAGRTPHSCRHTYAGLMTATGVPTALLGAYLGHSTAQTTMGYTQLAARYAQDPQVRTWARGEFTLDSRPGSA